MVEKPFGNILFEDREEDWWITLRRILLRWVMRNVSGCNWLRIVSKGGL
jgi:hypothetical protein